MNEFYLNFMLYIYIYIYIAYRPKFTNLTYYVREDIDWEAAACLLERDFQNLEDSMFIGKSFIEEADRLNAATNLVPATNTNSLPASNGTSSIEAVCISSQHDNEALSAYSRGHFDRQANEAVDSDGPRELVANSAAFSSSSAAPCMLTATLRVL